jgi:PAS domain S-box-containing protein
MELTNRYQNLISYLTDYIYTVKIKDDIAVETLHGPGCVSVTGYTSEDYKKDPELWYRMVHDKDREKVLEQAKLALLGEEVQSIEHRIIHRDGYTRWVKNQIVVTKDQNGMPVSYDGTREISSSKCTTTQSGKRVLLLFFYNLLQPHIEERGYPKDPLENPLRILGVFVSPPIFTQP